MHINYSLEMAMKILLYIKMKLNTVKDDLLNQILTGSQ